MRAWPIPFLVLVPLLLSTPGRSGALEIVTNTIFLGTGGGGFGSPTVSCPNGTKVLGGGLSSDQGLGGDPGSRMIASLPTDGDTGWQVLVQNDGDPAMFTVHAVCGNVLDHVIVTAIGVAIPGQLASPQVSCPAGSLVVGGGVSTNQDTAGGDPGSRMVTSQPVAGGTGWLARVQNDGGVGIFTVHAVCASVSDHHIETASIFLGDGEFAAPQATCPAGSAVMGGGLSSDQAAGQDPGSRMIASLPSQGGIGWQNLVQNDGVDANFTVHASCTSLLFADGFESGDASIWSNAVP